MTDDTKQLVCPNCGCPEFSWTVTMEQRGDYFEFNNGVRNGECYDTGPILSSSKPACTDCDQEWSSTELIQEDDYNDD